MQLGMIGLGRMGANMVRRLMRDGHACVVQDVSADAVAGLAKEGATGLEKFGGTVADSGEGPWTIAAANDEGVPAFVLTAALFERFASRNLIDVPVHRFHPVSSDGPLDGRRRHLSFRVQALRRSLEEIALAHDLVALDTERALCPVSLIYDKVSGRRDPM